MDLAATTVIMWTSTCMGTIGAAKLVTLSLCNRTFFEGTWWEIQSSRHKIDWHNHHDRLISCHVQPRGLLSRNEILNIMGPDYETRGRVTYVNATVCELNYFRVALNAAHHHLKNGRQMKRNLALAWQRNRLCYVVISPLVMMAIMIIPLSLCAWLPCIMSVCLQIFRGAAATTSF